jgi:8-oxo-dGTP pyrophosphatase MutT (NUDIX family)
MRKHISSGAIIYISDKRIIKFLIMYRRKSNSWHLPKGTQIAGESIKETALREVREETGLKINIEKYIGKLDSFFERDGKKIKKETNYFLAQPKGKKLLLNNHDSEHDKICFLKYKTALNHLENFSLHEKEGEILKMAEQVLRQS